MLPQPVLAADCGLRHPDKAGALFPRAILQVPMELYRSGKCAEGRSWSSNEGRRLSLDGRGGLNSTGEVKPPREGQLTLSGSRSERRQRRRGHARRSEPQPPELPNGRG